MLVLSHQFPIRSLLLLFVPRHPLLVEDPLSLGADLGDTLHGFEGLRDMVAVVADGDVAARSELKGAVDEHFFVGGFAEGFGPFELGAGVSGRCLSMGNGGWLLFGDCASS